MLYVSIEVIYISPDALEATFYSNNVELHSAIMIAEDFKKTGRVKHINFIDNNGDYWDLKELKQYVKGIQTDPHNVKIYFDGNFDLETSIAGLGCVIYYDKNRTSHRIRKNALIEAIGTNHEAEYAALYFGVKELMYLGVHHLPVHIFGDSLTVINQMDGKWSCYRQDLTLWADRIDLEFEKM